jgi:cell division protein FtsW (lipid II flippase)
MRLAGRRSLRYTAWSLVPIAALLAALGAAGIWMAILAAIPWLAWRYDNDSGTFLVFALLFLLVLGVAGLLLFLVAVTHS